MEVILSKCGHQIIVDHQDYALFKFMKWRISSAGYAYTCSFGSTFFMHRFFYKSNNSMVIDHINHNRLDNRRSNLRLVTKGINIINSYKKNKVFGVVKKWLVKSKKYTFVAIVKSKSIGRFSSLEQAVEYRRKYINNLYGIDVYKID